MSLLSLVQVAEQLGLKVRAVRADLAALASASLPAVLHVANPLDETDQGFPRPGGTAGVPTVFFLDRAATVRHINRGHGPQFPARAGRWLQDLLGRTG